jgi:hypothetical protein
MNWYWGIGFLVMVAGVVFAWGKTTGIMKTQLNGDFYSRKGITLAVDASIQKLDLLPNQQTHSSPNQTTPLHKNVLPSSNSIYLMDKQS